MVALQSIVMQSWRARRTGAEARRPACNPGHANAAFGEVHLAADERPVVAEALAAVVAREDDERVVGDLRRGERLEDPADPFVHVADHAAVGVDVAAVQMEQVVLDLGGDARVVARLPWPVRRGVCTLKERRRAGRG